jgi:23S rRNA (adenine2503-C2)-methyltransferase
VRSLLGHTPDELRELFAADGLPAFRASQVARWLFKNRVRDFDAMANLPRALRAQLEGAWQSRALERVDVHESEDGTRKLVLGTPDGARLEAVLIPEARRQTLCVSSQIGCSLDCSFCATGRMGFGRNLRAEEIVDQVLHACEILDAAGETLTHVVFMGMGEPLLNLANVVQAIRVLTHDEGFGLAPRRITVSTAGVVPRFADLAAAVPVRLAVSLHATTDAVRDELVPLNKRFPLAVLLDACAKYPLSRRDRLSFEYALLAGVNDSDADARRLARIALDVRAKLNLIPMNAHPGSPYRRPDDDRIDAFLAVLVAAGADATIRRSRGDDIYAACGQLGALAEAQRPATSPDVAIR